MLLMETQYHIPALLNETIGMLDIKQDGVYIDATFGGGGHSKAILERLSSKGKLIAFDRDKDAWSNINDDERLILIPANYAFIRHFILYLKIQKVDGIIADLGISSHQIDEPTRGFSFRFNASLDMRMGDNDLSAERVLNEYPADKLQKIFSAYGEIKNAKTLANHITASRKLKKIDSTALFAELATQVAPKNEHPNKYLAPVFQAIRMEVNRELESLQKFLIGAEKVLSSEGRIAILTYHSIEDRIVKDFFSSTIDSNMIMGNTVNTLWIPITKKPIIPTETEMSNNPRARSAKLRIYQKK